MDYGSKKLRELIDKIENMSVEEYEALYDEAEESFRSFANPPAQSAIESYSVTSEAVVTWTSGTLLQSTEPWPNFSTVYNSELLSLHCSIPLGSQSSAYQHWQPWTKSNEFLIDVRGLSAVGDYAVTVKGADDWKNNNAVSGKAVPEQAIYRWMEEKETDAWAMAA
jgi:hypothetical protein